MYKFPARNIWSNDVCYLTLLGPAEPLVAVAGNIVIDRVPYLSRNNQKCLC